MGAMQEMPEHDWVIDEGEAILAASPELLTSIRRQCAEDDAGALTTVDIATVRRMLDERDPQGKRHQRIQGHAPD